MPEAGVVVGLVERPTEKYKYSNVQPIRMSIDLNLGFREKPANLDATLAKLGFKLEKVVEPDDTFKVPMRSYWYFEEGSSGRGVWFTFHDGMYDDDVEQWSSAAPGVNIVASAAISTYAGRNRSDLATQQRVSRSLRDQYGAILYDPQEGKPVTD